jgi:hypothetical protein
MRSTTITVSVAKCTASRSKAIAHDEEVPGRRRPGIEVSAN